MPILSEETSLYPDGLLDVPLSDSPAHRWWVIYAKARQEKAIARQLLGHEVPFYLPVVKKTLFYRGRKVRSHVPLFPGYLFLFGSEEHRVCALTTNRTSRILLVQDQQRLHRDLQRIWQLILSSAPLTLESRLVPGKRVRIRYGALAGLEGVVIKRQGETRLVVSVDFIQQGASVQIDDSLLESVD